MLESRNSRGLSNPSNSTRQVLVYFGLISLLVNLLNPGFLLDIPTSYMLKNLLHASASQISLFRLLTAIPFYVGFVFGMVRDLWNPFGLRDRAATSVYCPPDGHGLAWMGFSTSRIKAFLIGMLLAAVAYLRLRRLQGLQALIGQEALMTGRLSALSDFSCSSRERRVFLSGFMSDLLAPPDLPDGPRPHRDRRGFSFLEAPARFSITLHDNPDARGAGLL